MRFSSEADVADLVGRVEACTFPLPDWHHDVHLAVLTWYLARHPRAEATRLMRSTIQRFNAHHGLLMTRETGYHETLTLAWIALVHDFLAKNGRGKTLVEKVEAVTGAFRDKLLLRRHYTRERIMSWEARLDWVEPDRRPLVWEEAWGG